MTLEQIKQAVAAGKTVYWSSKAYRVVKTTNRSGDDYSILCTLNSSRIGLTWADDVTLNGKEEDFFTD